MTVIPLWSVHGAATAHADAPPAADVKSAPASHTLFDPARHMHVSEVKPGMLGYGLTVFKGSKIERFDVEVLSVLHNFNPKSDVILIRCKGEYLTHTGSIAGMSGSPIYLTDSSGHDRMIGAFAYGWPLTKDPVAGVQPIEYMLKIPVSPHPSAEAASPSKNSHVEPGQTPAGEHASWSMQEAGMLPVAWQTGRAWHAETSSNGKLQAGGLLGDGNTPRLEPLATPLMTSGLSPKVFEMLAARFRAAGLAPLQAGVGGSAADAQDKPKLEPGSVLAVPLITGDMEMTAIGTTTEVIGDHIWGFGHPFNNEGPIDLPMGGGVINGIIANLNTSFKLGSLTAMRGTLTNDASVGVAGKTGKSPATIPIDLTIQPADGSPERKYHFNASRHAKFTPMIAAAAFAGAISGSSELPQYNTVDYDLRLSFENGTTVTLANRAANVTSGDLFGDAGVVMQAAAENPFQRVLLKKIAGTVKVRTTVAAAQILDVNLPKSRYRPGEKVKAYVTYQPFHGVETIVPVEMDLPRDLPHGSYQLVISDAQRYFADEQQSKPFRFLAEDIHDVFAVLNDVAAIRENAIYVRLLRRSDGVAIGHTALQRLPSSRREILLASGRSNMTPFVSSTVKIVPTEMVMNGSAEFTIDVQPQSKVAVGSPRGTKIESPAAPILKPSSEAPGKKEAPKESKPGE